MLHRPRWPQKWALMFFRDRFKSSSGNTASRITASCLWNWKSIHEKCYSLIGHSAFKAPVLIVIDNFNERSLSDLFKHVSMKFSGTRKAKLEDVLRVTTRHGPVSVQGRSRHEAADAFPQLKQRSTNSPFVGHRGRRLQEKASRLPAADFRRGRVSLSDRVGWMDFVRYRYRTILMTKMTNTRLRCRHR